MYDKMSIDNLIRKYLDRNKKKNIQRVELITKDIEAKI